MLKIEAVIQPTKLEDVREALENLGITGTLIQHVTIRDGHTKAYYRGAAYPADLPRIKIEMLVSSERVDEVVAALIRAARAPSGDDGLILLYEVADAIRIHNGAHLQFVLS